MLTFPIQLHYGLIISDLSLRKIERQKQQRLQVLHRKYISDTRLRALSTRCIASATCPRGAGSRAASGRCLRRSPTRSPTPRGRLRTPRTRRAARAACRTRRPPPRPTPTTCGWAATCARRGSTRRACACRRLDDGGSGSGGAQVPHGQNYSHARLYALGAAPAPPFEMVLHVDAPLLVVIAEAHRALLLVLSSVTALLIP